LLLSLMFAYNRIFTQALNGNLVFDTGSSCPQTSPNSCTSCSYTCPGLNVSNCDFHLFCQCLSFRVFHLQTVGSLLAAYYYNYNGSGNDMVCIFNDDSECLYDVSSLLLLYEMPCNSPAVFFISSLSLEYSFRQT
jgi:hypothetical protein